MQLKKTPVGVKVLLLHVSTIVPMSKQKRRPNTWDAPSSGCKQTAFIREISAVSADRAFVLRGSYASANKQKKGKAFFCLAQ